MDPLEEQARALGNDPAQLRARFKRAVSVLPTYQQREQFPSDYAPTFDFERKTYTGKGGMRLEWRVRQDPGSRITEHNQQTSTGTVMIFWNPLPQHIRPT